MTTLTYAGNHQARHKPREASSDPHVIAMRPTAAIEANRAKRVKVTLPKICERKDEK